MLFRESSIQGRLVNLRAADDLGRYVRLISGRLPARVRALALRGAAAEGRRADSLDAEPAARRRRPGHPEARRADRAVRAARAAHRDGRAGRPLPHATAEPDRDRERHRRALAHERARDVLPLVRVVRADAERRRSPVDGRCVLGAGAEGDRPARGEPGRVPGDRAHRHAVGGRVVVDCRSSPPAASGRRRRRAAARVHRPRRRGAAARRRRRPPAPAVVRRAALAGRAVHPGGGGCARRARHDRRLGRRRRRGRGGRRAGGLAGRAGRRPRAALARRPDGGARGRGRRRAPALRGGARAVDPARQARVHTARRRRARRDRRRARRMGARLDRRAVARLRQRNERLPAARSGADRLRDSGAVREAARAGAATARASGKARAGLTPPRRGVARPQPRARGDRRDVPGGEHRPRALRARLPLDARARPARRGGVRGPGVVRPDRGPLAAHSGAARRAGERVPDAAVAGGAAVGQRAERRDVHAARVADAGARERRGLAERLRDAAALGARPPADAVPQRVAAHDRTAAGTALRVAGLEPRRRRWPARDLPVAARRLRAGDARADARPRDGDAARPHPLRLGDARRAPVLSPQRRAVHGERRDRDPAEREGRADARDADRQRARGRPSVRRLGRRRRRERDRPSSGLPDHARPHRHFPPRAANRRPAARPSSSRRVWQRPRRRTGSCRCRSRASTSRRTSSASFAGSRRSSAMR